MGSFGEGEGRKVGDSRASLCKGTANPQSQKPSGYWWDMRGKDERRGRKEPVQI